MNPAEALELVEMAIEQAGPVRGSSYQIWWERGKFHCACYHGDGTHTFVLGIYNGVDLSKGLHVAQWNHIQNRIGELMIEGSICLNQSKR